MATVTHGIATASTSNVTSYASGSFTPAAGDLLIAFVVASGTVAAGSMTDSQSLGWTKITSAVKATSADTLYVFVANALTAASAMTVTFDCTGDAATGAIIFVARVAGMSRKGSNAVRQTAIQNNQTAATTPAPAFSAAALTSNPTLGLIGNATSPATLTPPTNWTERNDTGYSTPTTGGEYVSRDSGFTGTTITWGGTSATAFGAILVELDASNTGSLSSTLGAVTLSATGQVAIAGTANATLDAISVAATGTLLNQGQLAASLDAISVNGAGIIADPGITGEFNQSLGAITVSASAALVIKGSGSIALDSITANAAGKVALTGVASATLDPIGLAATGKLAITGTSNTTLGTVALTVTGALQNNGVAAASLDAIGLVATSALRIAGEATALLEAITLAASGQITNIIQGELSGTVGIALNSTGQLAIQGALAATLEPITAGAAGSLALVGEATAFVEAITLVSTGALPIAGEAFLPLDPIGVVADGALLIRGEGGGTVSIAMNATGTESDPTVYSNRNLWQIAAKPAAFSLAAKSGAYRVPHKPEVFIV